MQFFKGIVFRAFGQIFGSIKILVIEDFIRFIPASDRTPPDHVGFRIFRKQTEPVACLNIVEKRRIHGITFGFDLRIGYLLDRFGRNALVYGRRNFKRPIDINKSDDRNSAQKNKDCGNAPFCLMV
ncbi:MAG: hypothetical protein JSS81_03670 [Acidobacteria bacterium]|nr:hypothetical protein [Acidobacteriota bacterium]